MHIIVGNFFIAGTEEGATVAGLLPMGCSKGDCPLPGQIALGGCRLLGPRQPREADEQQHTNTPGQSTNLARCHAPTSLSIAMSSRRFPAPGARAPCPSTID